MATLNRSTKEQKNLSYACYLSPTSRFLCFIHTNIWIMKKANRMKGMIRFGLKYRVSRSIIAYLKINLLTGDLEKRVMESLVSSTMLASFPFLDSSRPPSLHYLTIIFVDLSSFHLDLHLNSQRAHLIFVIKPRRNWVKAFRKCWALGQ